MKILHVVSSMKPQSGGVSQALRTLLPALEEQGVSNHVACLDDPAVDYGIVDKLEFTKLGPGVSSWCYSGGLKKWLFVNSPQYDLLVLHGLWQYPGFAVGQAIRRLEKAGKKPPKLCVMPHGMLDPWFQTHSSRRIKALRNWFYWKLIEYRTIKEAQAVLFTCEKEMLLARRTFSPYSPQSEWVTGLAVDAPPNYDERMTESFRAQCPSIGNSDYLLYIGRIDPKKGIDLLIEAYASLKSSPIARGIPPLVIAGPLDSEYAKKMQALAGERGVMVDRSSTEKTFGVVFSGMLKNSAKWGAFYGCEAFILPSHQENFGIAVVEALACERPVLISDQINIHDEIQSSGSALVAPDTVDGVIELLMHWSRMCLVEKKAMATAAGNCYRRLYLPQQAAFRTSSVLRNI